MDRGFVAPGGRRRGGAPATASWPWVTASRLRQRAWWAWDTRVLSLRRDGLIVPGFSDSHVYFNGSRACSSRCWTPENLQQVTKPSFILAVKGWVTHRQARRVGCGVGFLGSSVLAGATPLPGQALDRFGHGPITRSFLRREDGQHGSPPQLARAPSALAKIFGARPPRRCPAAQIMPRCQRRARPAFSATRRCNSSSRRWPPPSDAQADFGVCPGDAGSPNGRGGPSLRLRVAHVHCMVGNSRQARRGTRARGTLLGPPHASIHRWQAWRAHRRPRCVPQAPLGEMIGCASSGVKGLGRRFASAPRRRSSFTPYLDDPAEARTDGDAGKTRSVIWIGRRGLRGSPGLCPPPFRRSGQRPPARYI